MELLRSAWCRSSHEPVSYTHLVFVSATYNIAYMQMDIDVVWEDDSSQPDYRTLGLHGRYNSHFQEFQYDDGYLRWNDGTASISIFF